MDIIKTTQLLGDISPQTFMREHWQKKPLLVRGAVDVAQYALKPEHLFLAAQRDDVQSRLIVQQKKAGKRTSKEWQVWQGPFGEAQALPASTKQPWTLLVQGMNIHNAAMAKLMNAFRFVPDARLDDVMVSYASPGGGVGAHVDSYDVFLLQLQGTRRWQIGPLKTKASRALVEGAPLKLLKNFKPTQNFDLGPGDMLYLPPGYGHDGVAVDECLTASIGFRAPRAGELVAEMLEQLADVLRQTDSGAFAQLYGDAAQAAVKHPAQLPQGMSEFLRDAWQRVQPSAADFEQVLGMYLSEPKPHVWFTVNATTGKNAKQSKASERGIASECRQGVRLAAATQMLYGKRAFFINGEVVLWDELEPAARAWIKRLADERVANAQMMATLPKSAHDYFNDWWNAGWLIQMQKNQLHKNKE